MCVFLKKIIKILFKADTNMLCSAHNKAGAAFHIANDEALCSLLCRYSFSSSHHTIQALSTKCGCHFLVAPSQNALFNYEKPERAAVEKGNTVRLGIWGGSGTAGSSVDLTTQGMNRVNGFQNR